MPLFVGRRIGAQIEKLGPIQADAPRAAAETVPHLVREFDVAEQVDLLAVAGDGRQVAQRRQLQIVRAVLLLVTAIAGQRFLVRLQDHLAAVAVHDHDVAAGNVSQERTDADDRGDFQSLGDDGGVAARSALLGSKAAHELAIEIRHFAGSEIMRKDQHRRGEGRDLFPPPAEQVAQQPLLDIENVGRPLGHVAVVERLKDLDVAAQGAADGVFRRVMALANVLLELGAQPRVAQHLQMGFEDRAVFPPQLERDGIAIVLDLHNRFGEGRFQSKQLFVHRVARDEAARDAKSLIPHDKCLADRHTGRNGDPLQPLHVIPCLVRCACACARGGQRRPPARVGA